MTDLVQGTAGVVLAAIWAGGEHAASIAATGGEALLNVADRAEGGLDWAMVPGSPSRAPNYSTRHRGVATALAIAGAALGRADFTAAAAQGARHLLAVGTLDDNGFTVPHTPPYAVDREIDDIEALTDRPAVGVPVRSLIRRPAGHAGSHQARPQGRQARHVRAALQQRPGRAGILEPVSRTAEAGPGRRVSR